MQKHSHLHMQTTAYYFTTPQKLQIADFAKTLYAWFICSYTMHSYGDQVLTPANIHPPIQLMHTTDSEAMQYAKVTFVAQ